MGCTYLKHKFATYLRSFQNLPFGNDVMCHISLTMEAPYLSSVDLFQPAYSRWRISWNLELKRCYSSSLARYIFSVENEETCLGGSYFHFQHYCLRCLCKLKLKKGKQRCSHWHIISASSTITRANQKPSKIPKFRQLSVHHLLAQEKFILLYHKTDLPQGIFFTLPTVVTATKNISELRIYPEKPLQQKQQGDTI